MRGLDPLIRLTAPSPGGRRENNSSGCNPFSLREKVPSGG